MKRVWLILGALIMGLSIWSMHFIGMLAQTMPMRVEYDAWMTALSMVAAVCGSGIAFLIIQRPVIHLLNITMGGIAMGLAIASMHYLGMASMRMQAVTVYNPYLFVLSIAIAIGASIGALWFTFYLGEKRLKGWVGKHLTGATVMGIAIAGMHYTGIAAAINGSCRGRYSVKRIAGLGGNGLFPGAARAESSNQS
jgi:methyl-accepting chemotaxis protein PixJ